MITKELILETTEPNESIYFEYDLNEYTKEEIKAIFENATKPI